MIDYLLGKEIASYVKRHKWLVICALVLTALSSLLVVIPAYLLQPFVDEGMKSGSDPVTWKIPWIAFEPGSWFSWHRTERVLVQDVAPNVLLLILTLVGLAAVMLKSISMYFGELSAAAFSNRAVRSLRVDLFRKFVSLPLGFYEKKKSGELVARATADLTVMQGRISSVIIGYIQHPLSAAVFLVYLLVMNFKLTLLVFLVAPVVLGLIRLFGRKVKKHAIRVQDTTAEVTSAYQETLLCLKVVHGFFKGEWETHRFRQQADQLYKRVMHWHRWDLGMGPLMDCVMFLILPGILIVGKVYFQHSLGELMSMMYAFSRLYSPVRKLARVNNNLRTLQGATERVFTIMNTVPSVQDRPDARILPRLKEAIEFNHVTFGYSPRDPVLKDISIRIKAGEMVAFVGSTGAGKTSILNLIPRFYDVTEGEITIDGIDIREVTLGSLRSQIGIVNQETILFHDTIAHNIGYGREKVSREEIVAAARAAHAHDFILAQTMGYDTVVGDQGMMLSGGQRQRIAIARALLIDPTILILDEAASALDAESEQHVQEAIEKLHGSRTILVVAHRLSTIMKADCIHVLEAGRIIESGNLNELLGLEGRFRQLYDMQFRHEATA
jgi:subfamily B ATP-binding cassette protein MsbA